MSEKNRLLKLSGLFEGVEAVNPTARRICSISKGPVDFVNLCRDHGLSREDVSYAVEHLYAATKKKTELFMNNHWPVDGAEQPADPNQHAMSEGAEFAPKRPQLDPHEYLDIDCPIGSGDFNMFKDVINQGIDSHLESFTKSRFLPYLNDGQRRMLFGFHKSELPILLRRLDAMSDEGNEDASSWASDIRDSEAPEWTKGGLAPEDGMDNDGTPIGQPGPSIHEGWTEPLEEYGSYNLVDQAQETSNANFFSSWGLDLPRVERLQSVLNKMTSDETWRNTVYPHGTTAGDVIHDIFKVVKDPKMFFDDEFDVHGPDATASLLKQKIKSKKSPMAMAESKKVKLGQLSEELRKEVEKLVKEGKTKLSQFPDDVRKKVIAETKA